MSEIRNWNHARLSDVVDRWIVGKTPSRTRPEYYAGEGGFPWAKAEDIQEGELTGTAEHLTPEGAAQMQRILPGAILVTTAGTIGRVARAGADLYCNQAVQALTFREDRVLSQYAYYYLRYIRPQMQRKANRANIPNLSKQSLGETEIVFPGLGEQRFLAGWLQMAERLCQKARMTQGLLERYRGALVRSLLTQAHTMCALGDLLQGPPQTGLSVKASPTGNGYAFVNGLGTAPYLYTAHRETSRVQVPKNKAVRYELEAGDILLRRSGNGIGVTLVEKLEECTLFGAGIVRLRPEPQYSAYFLSAWMLEFASERLTAELIKNGRELQRYQVPVPADTEDFDRRFSIWLELIKKAQAFVQRAEALYQSMTYAAFTGILSQDFCEETGRAFDSTAPRGSETPRLAGKNMRRLTTQMRQFCAQMSKFQQELYYMLLGMDKAMPVHTLMKRVKEQSASRETAQAGIQDALATVELLEAFGLLEREPLEKIPLEPPQGSRAHPAAEEEYVLDHNGHPIVIEQYKPTRDIFEENHNAAGTGED